MIHMASFSTLMTWHKLVAAKPAMGRARKGAWLLIGLICLSTLKEKRRFRPLLSTGYMSYVLYCTVRAILLIMRSCRYLLDIYLYMYL